MNQTKRSNSFERIAFRALIIILLFCVICGGSLAYSQYQKYQSFWQFYDQYGKEIDKVNTAEFNNCIDATNSADYGSQFRRCYDSHIPDFEFKRVSELANNADRLYWIGITLLLIPLPLFTIYFLLRWIITGRWRQAKE